MNAMKHHKKKPEASKPESKTDRRNAGSSKPQGYSLAGAWQRVPPSIRLAEDWDRASTEALGPIQPKRIATPPGDQHEQSPVHAERQTPINGDDGAIRKDENKTGLPDNLKTGVENLSGLSMDDVKVHYNSPKPAQLQALAYTQGTDIHVASGQETHVPHEAWHVVQQKQGRVSPTIQAKGISINDDGGLEKEADVMGVKAEAEVAQPLGQKARPSPISQPQEFDDSADKQNAAQAWIAQQLGAGVVDLATLYEVVAKASDQFGLTEAKLELLGDGKSRIGLAASPFNWVVGNNVSDFATMTLSIPVSYGSRWFRWLTGNWTGETNIRYGPLTGRGFGTFMEADPLTKKHEKGSSPSKKSDPTWVTLNRRRSPKGSDSYYYVQGHLLNENLGGTGKKWKNLTPLTYSSNNNAQQSHLNVAETEIKGKVNDDGKIMGYRVQAVYGRWPWMWPRYIYNLINYVGDTDLAEVLAAEDHIPVGLLCTWWEYDWALNYVPKIRYIRQWENRGDFYVINRKDGNTLDYSDQHHVWSLLESTIKAAIAAGLIVAVPSVAGVAVKWTPALVSDVLTQVASSVGSTVPEFIIKHQFNTTVIVSLISGMLSTGKVEWSPERLGALNI